MSVDGEKLRTLRLQKGMSQEKLAMMSNLNKRTIQRAENGQPVALESLAFIADTLEVQPATLRSAQIELFEAIDAPATSRDGEVILVPATRGSRLVNTLRGVFGATFEYDAEPTDENLEALQEIAAVLNGSWVNPWEAPFESGADMSDTELLQLQAKANKSLASLASSGVRVFLGTYPTWAQIPQFDMDEGHMYIKSGIPEQKVQSAIVIVSAEPVSHLARMPKDHADTQEAAIPF